MLIYADNAATTRLSSRALRAMLPFLEEQYGNPSSIHPLGQAAARALVMARETAARCLGARPSEITFTSGGSESDNQALLTAARLGRKRGRAHLISSRIEHPAVLRTLEALEENEGCEVTLLPVTPEGFVRPASVLAAIRPDTACVSIMTANNETGTVQDIAAIGQICRDKGILFHTDAVQAAGILPVDVERDSIDMMSVSAHKFNGPKGVGFLYCRRNVHPETFMDGGAQERGHRAGTENVAGIVGMAKAFEDAAAYKADLAPKLAAMRDHIQAGLLEIPDCRVNGDQENRLPGTLNVSFPGIDGQSLLFSLDLKGVEASSGSACASGSLDPSHVLMAIGLPYTMAHGSMRITVGRYNTMEEADYIIRAVKETVAELRNKQ